MKTAEEIAMQIFNEGIKFAQNRSSSVNETMGNLVKEYAREACRKQREICAKLEDRTKVRLDKMAPWAILEHIENAPEPDLK